MLQQVSDISSEIERDGFYVFKNSLDPQLVDKARGEIQAWLDTDIRQRQDAGSDAPWFTGDAGTSILTKPTQILLDAYAKSPALDLLVEQVLSDPLSSGVLKQLAGENIKFRGYNVQRMTGEPDPRPTVGSSPNPHEWHRDSPGEFGIALFLEDVPGPENGATSLVPGSHYFPYCPRWNCLFGPPFKTKEGTGGLDFFLRFNIANRMLGRRINSRATGAYGKQGDFYFFINDVWHGREPNMNGRTGIKFMIGAFPSDEPFPDKVVPPDEATLAKLPPLVRKAASQASPAPSSETPNTILQRVRRHRAENPPANIFKMAQHERQFTESLSRLAYKFSERMRTVTSPFAGRFPWLAKS
jgi:hypothetical protein